MNKPFCDLCGKAAHESPVSARLPRGEKWSGGKPSSDGVGVVQGIWQSSIRVTVEFRADDFKTVRAAPDLCTDCIYGLLDDLARTLLPAGGQGLQSPATQPASPSSP